ncbi:T6SS immunity protein Tli4 family protein [Methylibium rhizosphaerae]|uniref:T6SS immunity protein Tli4 family protein n=1 Tax=Methylibium rhizosphaerae TaxID=2570323 RepID=UPI001128770A|nr:T6SS immunity protein Tli4 family protein [Methylibium rhizosphaerae]
MIGRLAHASLSLLFVCAALAACAEETPPTIGIGTTKWSDACLGLHAFKLPHGVVAAAYEPRFLQPGYGFAGLFGLMGGVSLGSADLIETTITDLNTFSRSVRAQAFGQHSETRLLGLDKSGKVRRDYRMTAGSQELNIKYPNSFAWRHLDTYSSGAWIEADHRARIIKGKLTQPNADKDSASREVQALWSSYRTRHASDVPAERGLCTAHGFVAEVANQRAAAFSAYVSYRDESQPALIYTISIAPGLVGSQEKLEDQPQPWRETPEEAKQRQEQSKRKGEWLSIGPGALVEKYLEPEYLTVAGQRARLSGVKFRPSMDQYDYEVQIETLGDPSDPKKPRIIVMAQGLKAKYYTGLQGQPPAPPLEQVLPTLKAIAQSMRVR